MLGARKFLRQPGFDGNVACHDDPKQFGFKIEQELLDPGFFLVADEAGISANQKADKF